MPNSPPRTAGPVRNADLLREIAASKLTYAWLADPEAARFERTLLRLDEVAPEDRVPGLVVRVMTSSHIPPIPDGVPRPPKRRGRTRADGEAAEPEDDCDKPRLSCAPFQHWRVREDGSWEEVARSHWTGGLADGRFDPAGPGGRGRINDALVLLMLTMVERYSKKANWRHYSYVDEMRAASLAHLAAVALRFDERVSSNPFAWITSCIHNCFLRVLKVERRAADLRDDLLSEAGLSPSYRAQIAHETAERAERKSLEAGDG